MYKRCGVLKTAFILTAAVLTAVVCASPVDAKSLPIWFGAPALDWESEGLPLGNGAMGIVVTGEVARETLQLNEKTLWTGGPGAKGYNFGLPVESIKQDVAQVRQQIAQHNGIDPQTAADKLGQNMHGYGHYQSFGELDIQYNDQTGAVSNYVRSLDLNQGVATVAYTRNNTHYKREYFVSYPQQAAIVKLSASNKQSISFDLGVRVHPNRTIETEVKKGVLTFSGKLFDNNLQYIGKVQIVVDGGELTENEKTGRIQVSRANSAVISIVAATNYAQAYPHYRGKLPVKALDKNLAEIKALDYSALLAEHFTDYTALFGRVELSLIENAESYLLAKPTPELLKQYKGEGSAPERALEQLYFQFGRYLLIASSRNGSLPANLQGVWNNSATPPWNADYHVNINLQMNYWPAQVTNLGETALPLFDFIDSLVEPGKQSAQKVFGARGWTLFLNTNIFGYTGLIEWPTAFWQPEAAAWLAQHYFEHYQFYQDHTFLTERAYPVMKEAALFWVDVLVADPNTGLLVVSPSFSPEQGPFVSGAAMSQQIVFDLFTNVVEAANLVGDTEFKKLIQTKLAKLDPGTRIGSWGQLQEWQQDIDDKTNKHRHISHLFALHPGDQISVQATPAFAEAAKVSLNARGDEGTGWSRAWKVNFWARLLDGDRAHKLLAGQLMGSTLPNLWDTHPPFQIDGNFGATAGMAEMLIQSHTGQITLLPALPKQWQTGAVTGLRARGDVQVSMRWANSKLVDATLLAGKSQPINLALPHSCISPTVKQQGSNKNKVTVSIANTAVVFSATRGELYRVTCSNK